MRGQTGAGPVVIGIVNSGQHAIDCRNGQVNLSVLRSAAYCHEQGQALEELPATRFMDIGEHEFRLLVTAGVADEVRQRLPALADWLDSPPAVFAHLRPTGECRKNDLLRREADSKADHHLSSLLQIEPANVRLTACKKADDGDALIVRLHESMGHETIARVQICGVPDKIELVFQELEIKTLRVERDGSYSMVDMIEETKNN